MQPKKKAKSEDLQREVPWVKRARAYEIRDELRDLRQLRAELDKKPGSLMTHYYGVNAAASVLASARAPVAAQLPSDPVAVYEYIYDSSDEDSDAEGDTTDKTGADSRCSESEDDTSAVTTQSATQPTPTQPPAQPTPTQPPTQPTPTQPPPFSHGARRRAEKITKQEKEHISFTALHKKLEKEQNSADSLKWTTGYRARHEAVRKFLNLRILGRHKTVAASLTVAHAMGCVLLYVNAHVGT